MKRSNSAARKILLCAAAALMAAVMVQAQINTERAAGSYTSTPVMTKQGKIKASWLKAEVVHADRNSIVVREQDRPLFIHTFTYGSAVKTMMENRADNDTTFHTGDVVKIEYLPGQTVALKIHGKPSKP